ncbi:hypothetical protein M422DRAFT_247321 [Sphaerobolus stellatus SS14]|nr:hypothetical protein M422DRAFT_247321 [Sphaerobolus stellatus SS14]
MATLTHLQQVIQCHVPLHELPLNTLLSFIHIVRLLRPQIIHTLRSPSSNVPLLLPDNIHNFLRLALDLDENTVSVCWEVLRELIWDGDEVGNLDNVLALFLNYGPELNIAAFDFYPPTRTCTQPDCPTLSVVNKKTYLDRQSRVPIVFHTVA